MRILVVEDDAAIARLHSRVRSEDGHAVDVAETGEQARLLEATEPYDGIVLDVGLRDRNGLQVLAEWRGWGISTPVLVCTGRDGVDDVVRGLDAGADEYVVKPVAVAELRARVRALLRRAGPRRADQLTIGNLHLDRITRDVLVDGAPVPLTAREHALLEYLLPRAGEPIRRSELLEKVWDLTFDPGTSVVDVVVARIRRKLEAAGSRVVIETVRGVGFKVGVPELRTVDTGGSTHVE